MPSHLDILGHHVPTWQAVAFPLAAIIAVTLAVRLARRLRRWNATPGVKGAALVALMATGVSMDTNWLFWGTHLHVTNVVLRALLFADLEEALLVFAVQARENKLRPGGNGKQGIQGVLVWVMSGIAMFPAWIEAGILDGTVRAIAGPLLAATLWHFALGLEFKIERPKMVKAGTFATIGRNLRERALARLGMTAPDVSALEIRQDRALRTAVRLAVRLAEFDGWFFPKVRKRRLKNRLRTAVRLSGAADSQERQDMISAQVGVIRHADELATRATPSPWAARLAEPTDSFRPTETDPTGLTRPDGAATSGPTDHDDTDRPAEPTTPTATVGTDPTRRSNRPTRAAGVNRPTTIANGRARPTQGARSDADIDELAEAARVKLAGRTPTADLIRKELQIGQSVSRLVRDRLNGSKPTRPTESEPTTDQDVDDRPDQSASFRTDPTMTRPADYRLDAHEPTGFRHMPTLVGATA